MSELPERDSSTESRPEPSPPDSVGATYARGSTLLVTNVTTIVGLGLAINELVIRHGETRNGVLILCGAFVLGVQVVENTILRAIDRLFAKE